MVQVNLRLANNRKIEVQENKFLSDFLKDLTYQPDYRTQNAVTYRLRFETPAKDILERLEDTGTRLNLTLVTEDGPLVLNNMLIVDGSYAVIDGNLFYDAFLSNTPKMF